MASGPPSPGLLLKSDQAAGPGPGEKSVFCAHPALPPEVHSAGLHRPHIPGDSAWGCLDHCYSGRAVTWAPLQARSVGPRARARPGPLPTSGPRSRGPDHTQTVHGPEASCPRGGTQMDRLPGSGQHPACRAVGEGPGDPLCGRDCALGAALRWPYPGIPPGHERWPVQPSGHIFFQSPRPCGARPWRTVPCARRPCHPPSWPPRPELETWKVREGPGPPLCSGLQAGGSPPPVGAPHQGRQDLWLSGQGPGVPSILTLLLE